MAHFHGIEVFEILENGNILNAIYTNTDSNYDVQNEIAKKKTESLNTGIIGIYNARYIEINNDKVINCTLEITAHGEAYDFEWKDKHNKTIWKGIGLKAGINHIAVSYI